MRWIVQYQAEQPADTKRFRVQTVCASSQGWKIVDADFSQMELRLVAALAKDKNMTAAFQRGEDLHDYTAEQMGWDR